MTPRLFSENATTFTSNGLGNLSEALSCDVTEELNGIFELEMTYPITGKLYSSLVTSAIILAEPNEGGEAQAFRIYKISKPMNGRIDVFARHISYQANWIPVMPFTASSLEQCLNRLKSYSASTNPFTLWTNKTVASGIAWTVPQSFRSMLGGTQGSVLQIYGGDYEWDNWTIKLWSRRGSDTGVRIAYGKNLIDAKQESNIETTYTGVCPFWNDEETQTVVTLPEKYILASTASDFPFERIKTVDFSSDFDEQPTVTQLRNRTNQYITANNIGHPVINIDVNFVALWQTEEYAGIAPLETVKLGDTVTVDIERLGISETARVVAYTYDVLKGRYSNITIGDAKSSFAKTFVNQGAAIETSLGQAKAYTGKAVAAAKSYATSYTDSEVDQAIQEAEATAQELMENATNWLTASGGYVVAVKNSDGSWKELLFLDTPSTTTAQKVLRINENGMGFSSTGVNGPYKQAWTLDGKLVVGGTDAVTISAVNGSNREIFGVNSQGINWLLQSSIMTKSGTLYFLAPGATASSGNVLRLNSSGICFGKKGYNGAFSQAWDMNGKLMVGGTNAVVISAVDGNKKEIFNVNADGISWTMAQSIMKKNGTLYFLGNGATANSGNVLRLNNLGISFSKNGYNGIYNQSWTIDGKLSLGGVNNQYGEMVVYDDAGNPALMLNKDYFQMLQYNSQGEQIFEAFMNWNGMTMEGEYDGSKYTVGLAPLGGLVAYEEENGQCEVQASFIALEDTNGKRQAEMYIDADGVGNVEAGAASFGSLTVNGRPYVRFPGGATNDFFISGEHLYFENGLLVEVVPLGDE